MLELFGFFAIFFAASFGLAYLLVTQQERAKAPTLQTGAVLRIKCSSGIYRSMLIEEAGGCWVLSAPLQRDNYVAIRPGEILLVEAADRSGAYMFRTEVVSRDSQTHVLLVRKPSMMRRIERREASRPRRAIPIAAVLEGEEAQVVDLSELGARIATRAQVGRGERVRLDMVGCDPVYAWVLETLPGSLYGYYSSEVRVRFEETPRRLHA